MAIALRRVLIAMLAGALLVPGLSMRAEPTPKTGQFIYVLRLSPHFHDERNWTDRETALIKAHFDRLAQAVSARQVVLAGRTSETLDRTFGIVIFEAKDEEAARKFMEADPAVSFGLMSATLHPYSVALQRKPSAE